jgi:MscS family membrane protein
VPRIRAHILILLPLLIAAAAAQDPPKPETPPCSTPRETVESFFAACRAGDFASAATLLDLHTLPPDEREEGATLARQLEVVLEQTGAVEVEALSDEPAGRGDEGLPADLERAGRIQTPDGEVSVLLRHNKADPPAWRFSASTVRRIPALHDEFGFGVLGELLPARFLQTRFLQLRLWQWLGMLLLILVAWLLSWLVARLLYALLKPLAGLTDSKLDDQFLDKAMGPLRLLAGIGLFGLGNMLLHLSEPARDFLHGLQRGAAVVALAWLFMRLVDIASLLLHSRLQRTGRTSALTVLPLGEKTVKVLVLGLSLLIMLQNLGLNITGLLAGLGVGGLAVALAAQKTVENLFGGVSLIMDQPVRVGDFCRYGDKIGTVEDIGLRSTRIRSLDRSVVTVPNSSFAYMQLENFAPRDRTLFNPTLGLRRDTSPDQMRQVLAGLRELLASHPSISEGGHVRFSECGESSLDVEIFAYVGTADWEQFLAVKEELLLRLLDVVAAAGTELAVPTRISLAGRDAGIDPERRREAERLVSARREARELPPPLDGPQAGPKPEAGGAQENGKSSRQS